MNAKKQLMRRSLALAAVVLVVVAIIGVRVLLGFGITFHWSFTKIQPGMLESQVVAALGTPCSKSAEFRLGQREGFEKEYARAAASGSAYYLLWEKGMDVVYAVGFDKNGRVTMTAAGGT
ncbi:MAG: hypothetical protein JXB10_11375 [Pirellulales bacterium]|nr:hypothetical protein [Pirellulales bacterium]